MRSHGHVYQIWQARKEEVSLLSHFETVISYNLPRTSFLWRAELGPYDIKKKKNKDNVWDSHHTPYTYRSPSESWYTGLTKDWNSSIGPGPLVKQQREDYTCDVQGPERECQWIGRNEWRVVGTRKHIIQKKDEQVTDIWSGPGLLGLLKNRYVTRRWSGKGYSKPKVNFLPSRRMLTREGIQTGNREWEITTEMEWYKWEDSNYISIIKEHHLQVSSLMIHERQRSNLRLTVRVTKTTNKGCPKRDVVPVCLRQFQDWSLIQ